MSETDTLSPREAREKITDLVRSARICMLTTMTADGRHVSRPMGLQEAEFDGDLWFFLDDASDKAGEIRGNPEVNVSFSDDDKRAWVSISGRAEITRDDARAKEYWTPFLKAWFPDGLATPSLALLKVHARSAEYWEAPGGRVVTLISMAKAAVTRSPAAVGENASVQLG
jgi:general stress protein 26